MTVMKMTTVFTLSTQRPVTMVTLVLTMTLVSLANALEFKRTATMVMLVHTITVRMENVSTRHLMARRVMTDWTVQLAILAEQGSVYRMI
jgi:hypothetical protein